MKTPANNKLEELKINMRDIEEKIVDSKCSKKSKKYYYKMQKLMEYLADNKIVDFSSGIEDSQATESNDNIDDSPCGLIEKNNRRAFVASKITLFWNSVLLIAKIVACVMSKSMSMISSTLDSVVDILSSGITYLTNYKIRRLNVYKFPQGKTRMIPLSIISISIIMAISNIQIVIESVKRIITGNDLQPEVNTITLVIVIFTIVSKVILFIYCRSIPAPSAELLAQDSRNDVLTNIAVLAGLVISKYWWKYGDSVCGLIISLYVVANWSSTGISNLSLLVGKSASPQQIQRYGWVCILHEPNMILYISTIRAYTFGNRYLVEVDIVLREDLQLKIAHNIGESLQIKLESLPDVERAFVHLDFEKDHNPHLEHKLGTIF